jgi:hypothetical protein
MSKKLKNPRLFRWLAVGTGFVVLYLFSVGPSEVLWKRGLVSESVLRAVYCPLLPIAGTSFERPLAWYCDLWTGRTAPCCPDEVAR